MKKFLALYNAPKEVMQQWASIPPEEQKKSMDDWNAWGEKHKADLVEFGNPVGKNRRIKKDGSSDESNEIGGFSIVQAESIDEAEKIFADSPHFDSEGTYIELMELMDM